MTVKVHIVFHQLTPRQYPPSSESEGETKDCLCCSVSAGANAPGLEADAPDLGEDGNTKGRRGGAGAYT